MFKLYYTPGTCALASHIALEDAGARYEAVRISFKTNQQNSPEYLAINPKGRVPSLVTDRGILLDKATEADDPFATFAEWTSEADEKAYADF